MSSISKLTLLVYWFLIVLIAELKLFKVFSFINETDTWFVKFSAIPHARDNFIYLSIFALISATIIYAGSINKKAAKILLYVGVAIIPLNFIAVWFLASGCNGSLGCIGLIKFFVPVAIVAPTIPPLIFLLNEKNKVVVRIIVGIFIALIVSITLAVYIFSSHILPKNAETAKSEVLKKYVGFKPQYVPFKEESLIEGVNYMGEYYLYYRLAEKQLNIHEAKPRGLIEQAKQFQESHLVNIAENLGIMHSSLDMGGYFRVDLTWIDKNTEIHLVYQGEGYPSIEEAETDTLKIAQSMQPIN